jgi:hypothetical protein
LPAASSPATKEKSGKGKKEDKEKSLFQRVREVNGPGVNKSGGTLSWAWDYCML